MEDKGKMEVDSNKAIKLILKFCQTVRKEMPITSGMVLNLSQINLYLLREESPMYIFVNLVYVQVYENSL